jgi:putative N-acetylmannosamine-6-phosphate epimerase
VVDVCDFVAGYPKMDNKQENEMFAILGKLSADVETVKHAVMGNGQPGLVQRVDSLEANKNQLWGVGGAITFLAGVAEWFFHRKP